MLPLQLCILALCALTTQADTRWSRQYFNPRQPVTRERRQFNAGDWIPLTQPCLTCRPVSDPADTVGAVTRFGDIGLTPPRPPVTRQIHGTNNHGSFFPDESSILQAPPPPFPSRHHVTPQYQDFLQQFSNPNVVQFTGHNFFPQQQSSPYLQQSFLNPNSGFLFGGNPPISPLLNNQNLLLSPSTTVQPQGDIKDVKLDKQKEGLLQQPIPTLQQPLPQLQQPIQQTFHHMQQPIQQIQQIQHHQIQQIQQPQPQNIQLHENKPNHNQELTRLELPLPNAPVQFLPQPQMLVLNPSDPYLTPPPVQNTTLPQIPGLEKEEIQLLYVPVETLRQRGQISQRLPPPQSQPPQQQKVQYQTQFGNQQVLLRPLGQPNGHYITQGTAPPPPQISTTTKQVPVSPSSVTIPTLLVHSLPSAEAPQQFVTLAPRPAISDLPPLEEYVTEPQRIVSIQPRPQTTTEYSTTFTRFQEKPVSEQSFIRDNELVNLENEKVQNTHQQVQLQQQIRQQQRPQRPHFIQQVVTTELPLTTTLAPHQPPLSVFMGKVEGDIRVVDVLRALKDAKTIPVLDNVPGRNGPKVFVGPANLIPPQGFGKFELPYLSNIENNRVERKVERLPFFVAPLNFTPPPGYSKIPFPSPHVGSVVISSETAMRAALLHEKGTTANSIQEDYNSYSSLADVNPELPGLINDLESEKGFVTTVLPETTSLRTRPRRPTNVYRPPGRRPVPNSRLRPTQSAETEQEYSSDGQFLKETSINEQGTTSQYNKRVTQGRRYRQKTTTSTTTDNYFESRPSEETSAEDKYFINSSPQPVSEESIMRSEDEFGTPASETKLDLPSSTPLSSNFDYVQQNEFPSSTSKEIQGIFDVSPQPEHTLTVETNGNSGYFQQNTISSTEQPLSSTQFFEHTHDLPVSTQTSVQESSQTVPAAEEEKFSPEREESVDIPKKSKYAPYVPGVKVTPNQSSVKTRTHVRSRPRGRVSFQPGQQSTFREQQLSESQIDNTSSKETQEEPITGRQTVVEAAATEASSEAETEVTTKPSRVSQFYRGTRKPLRTTPPTRETTRSSNTYTLRPQRRSTVKTSVSTKRIRKPTTPGPVETTTETYGTSDASYGRKRPSFSPSGVSNEIYDERPSPRPSPRKPFFPRQKNVDIVEYDVSTTSSTTQQYQARKDVNIPTEVDVGVSKGDQYPEWNPAESGMDISGIVLTTMPPPGGNDSEEESAVEEKKKHVENTKKATDPELEKKAGRRRVRVRVHKRPHDNFETAESQNVGTVSNILVPPTPAKPNSEPDLYRFSKSHDFDFDATGKFIGTNNKDHVRNITVDIIESTNSFSAPGVENDKDFQELQKVTIADVPTTMPTVEAVSSTTSTPEEVVKTEEKVAEVERVETTTETDVGTTTEAPEESGTTEVPEPETTTTPPAAVTKVKQSRIIKTSTSHQVSHETEICYKGKCIKTNSANPDKDLKLLVEAANAEARIRVDS